jgi:hypothetical protein
MSNGALVEGSSGMNCGKIKIIESLSAAQDHPLGMASGHQREVTLNRAIFIKEKSLK